MPWQTALGANRGILSCFRDSTFSFREDVIYDPMGRF